MTCKEIGLMLYLQQQMNSGRLCFGLLLILPFPSLFCILHVSQSKRLLESLPAHKINKISTQSKQHFAFHTSILCVSPIAASKKLNTHHETNHYFWKTMVITITIGFFFWKHYSHCNGL